MDGSVLATGVPVAADAIDGVVHPVANRVGNIPVSRKRNVVLNRRGRADIH